MIGLCEWRLCLCEERMCYWLVGVLALGVLKKKRKKGIWEEK